jgi:hypothetical protein
LHDGELLFLEFPHAALELRKARRVHGGAQKDRIQLLGVDPRLGRFRQIAPVTRLDFNELAGFVEVGGEPGPVDFQEFLLTARGRGAGQLVFEVSPAHVVHPLLQRRQPWRAEEFAELFEKCLDSGLFSATFVQPLQSPNGSPALAPPRDQVTIDPRLRNSIHPKS